MEKNRALDACHRTCWLILLLFALCSCSIPRLAVIRDPLTPEEHLQLGLSYEKNQEYDAALKEYNLAVSRLPLAYLYIGNVHFHKKEFEKAASSYKKAIETTRNPHAYNNLAWLYYTTDRNLEEAEGLAEKAVTLAPDIADFKDTLSRIQERRKEKASALSP